MATFEIESNDTTLTATDLGSLTVGEVISLEANGQLSSIVDVDLYSILVSGTSVGSGINWSFVSPLGSSTDGTSDTDDAFQITFYDSNLNVIAVHNSDLDKSGTFAAPEDGVYYARIEAGTFVSTEADPALFLEEYGLTLPYSFTFTNSEDYAETETNDTTLTADEAVFGRYYVGQVSSGADVDYFKYSVTDVGLISVDFDTTYTSEVDTSGGETYKIQIYSPSGSNISTFYTELDVTGFDFLAENTGTYYISVTHATLYESDCYRIRATATTSSGGDGDSTDINGGAGNDYLTGSEGDDTIDGLSDADLMAGDLGNDYYYVDDKKDKIIESASEGTDTIESAIDLVLFGNVEKLILAGTADKGTGNALDNSIVGNELVNKLYGMAGDDMLDGSSGADKMYGGSGDDIYYVDDSKDKITEAKFGGDDTVYASVDILEWYTGTENLILVDTTVQAIGDGKDNTVHGNDSFNHIEGKGGDDTLYGEGGNDDIRGGTGNDTLEGGDGSDVFVFDAALSATANLDEITDFEDGTDKLWLSKSVFGKLAKGALSDNYFYEYAGTPSAQDANDYLIFDTDTGTLYYDADGSGSGEAIAFVVLDGITASDILII